MLGATQGKIIDHDESLRSRTGGGISPSRRHGCAASIAPLAKWRLRRVADHVAANIDAPLSLAELAAAAGLSWMYFAAQFRQATGITPHDYLLRRRIEHAMTAMESLSSPLVEIALTVGFQSQSHFTTVFKRLTGETPAAWRRNCGSSSAGSRSDPVAGPAAHLSAACVDPG